MRMRVAQSLMPMKMRVRLPGWVSLDVSVLVVLVVDVAMFML